MIQSDPIDRLNLKSKISTGTPTPKQPNIWYKWYYQTKKSKNPEIRFQSDLTNRYQIYSSYAKHSGFELLVFTIKIDLSYTNNILVFITEKDKLSPSKRLFSWLWNGGPAFSRPFSCCPDIKQKKTCFLSKNIYIPHCQVL